MPLALTWYEWFKTGHVLAAVLWVGNAVHGDCGVTAPKMLCPVEGPPVCVM